MLNAMWAIDDFTDVNGATRLIPGSHLWQRSREPQSVETVKAIASAGSLIMWLGGVLHGGGANNSTEVRRGVVMSYRLGWLASGEKLLLSIPPQLAKTFPIELQRLIGYQLHRPNLGWVDGRDPIYWLHGEAGCLGACDDNLTPAQETLLDAVQINPGAYEGYL
jgi:ectoine hydroxylase-related dioxygenase (phytanoyl-CoA dioxygenase family)